MDEQMILEDLETTTTLTQSPQYGILTDLIDFLAVQHWIILIVYLLIRIMHRKHLLVTTFLRTKDG